MLKIKQGKVKWYNKEKGYGFIEAEGEKDYFVNKYNIEGKDYLEEGDKVEFETKEEEKGREAFKVKKVETILNLSFEEISYLYSTLLEDLEIKTNLSLEKDKEIIKSILNKIEQDF